MRLQCVGIFIGTAVALQPLPPVQWTKNDTSVSGGFLLKDAPRKVFLQRSIANRTDSEGLTLVPPTALEFAKTFGQDLSELFGGDWSVEQVDSAPESGIFLGEYKGNASQLTYENGVATEEGYELEVRSSGVFIGGTGSRGLFWGTRALLQELLIANGDSLAPGHVVDAPAYATRGYMLDAGRKWYTAEFLKELCTYSSFFKLNEFHYHSSDNYPLNRGHNQTWNEVFSHFSLYPEDPKLQGIVLRPNETLSKHEFLDLQHHCAQRGVTVILEIEAPGHCLAITKWKPELALKKKDLLNLTHPDAIPTVKAIWSEFLPWVQSKEVHIGADEYDHTLADVYINFVNEMADFVKSTSGKRVRIWGTNEPSENFTISKDVIVQHWQYGESDPVKLQDEGYDLINSEDWWAYMSLKNDHTPILPLPYAQFFNTTRTLNFANVEGWQWDPSLFNYVNASEQLKPGASGNKGAILAAWSDSGPEATTQLEGYYAMRNGIPLVAARAWAGRRGVNVSTDDFEATLDLLIANAPGQNLERRFTKLASDPAKQDLPFFDWSSAGSSTGNVSLGHGSYGPPYTLSIKASGPFTLLGPDTSLSIDKVPSNISAEGTNTLVFTTADGFPYPLRSTDEADGHDAGHPGRIWWNLTSSTHHPVPITFPAEIRIETDVVNGSRVWVNDEFKGRYEVFVFGGRNTVFSWSQMALVAPLQSASGALESVVLEHGIGGSADNSSTENPPSTGNAGRLMGQSTIAAVSLALAAGMLAL